MVDSELEAGEFDLWFCGSRRGMIELHYMGQDSGVDVKSDTGY